MSGTSIIAQIFVPLNSDRDTAKTHREDTQGISQRHKMASSLDVPVVKP